MTTTFRSDVRGGLYALLTGFQTANPTLLHHVYRRRPGSFPDKFSGYVGSMPEAVAHDSGTRRRTMAPTVVLVGRMTEPASEMADDLDDLVDLFLDYCTANPRAAGNDTVVAVTAIEDVELDVEGTFRPAVVFTFGDTLIQEGRL
jgi:hypothetical protein